MRTLVVLPTYNERATVGCQITSVVRALPEAHVLVVDDSSPDGTAAQVAQAAAALGCVDLLVRPAKAGLGAAYRLGFAWGLARGYEVLVEMDSDLSHDAAALPQLLAAIEAGADLAIGSRYVAGGSVLAWNPWRRALSRAANVYAASVLGLDVKDSTSGFRAYTATLLEKLAPLGSRAEGYAFQVEMAYLAKAAGATIAEVPIRFVDRASGSSKMSLGVVAEAAWLVSGWGARRLRGR
jgi:dolichol-phosphate mannosyltransferase